jgi:hypothetical protein
MEREEPKGNQAEKTERQPYRVRLPRFITQENIGLGDAIKRATYAAGIKTCGGCERRAAVLNRWFLFSGGGPK